MKRFLVSCPLLMIFVCHAYGQSVQLQGSQLSLPPGNVIGAAFENDLLIIQQSVLSAEGPSIHSERHLLSVDLTSNDVVKTVMSPRNGTALVGNRCGQVRVDSSLGRIFVCSNESTVAALDSKTFQAVGSINCKRTIEDFVVDEHRHRLLVISQSNSNRQYLSIYDSENGASLEEVNVSSGAIDAAQLALNSHTQRLGLAESHLKHSGYVTDLYGCSYRDSLKCDRVGQIGQISQIAISGNEMLTASGLLADDPHVCLTQVNLVTKVMTGPYCSPNGVHYGVGVLRGQYIVGYTGASKRLHFKEETEPLNSSVSIWKVETSNVAGTATQSNFGDGFQEGVRIACSNLRNHFLLFSQTSNIAYIYSVAEISQN